MFPNRPRDPHTAATPISWGALVFVFATLRVGSAAVVYIAIGLVRKFIEVLHYLYATLWHTQNAYRGKHNGAAIEIL
jgi:hypothetical protein